MSGALKADGGLFFRFDANRKRWEFGCLGRDKKCAEYAGALLEGAEIALGTYGGIFAMGPLSVGVQGRRKGKIEDKKRSDAEG